MKDLVLYNRHKEMIGFNRITSIPALSRKDTSFDLLTEAITSADVLYVATLVSNQRGMRLRRELGLQEPFEEKQVVIESIIRELKGQGVNTRRYSLEPGMQRAEQIITAFGKLSPEERRAFLAAKLNGKGAAFEVIIGLSSEEMGFWHRDAHYSIFGR